MPVSHSDRSGVGNLSEVLLSSSFTHDIYAEEWLQFSSVLDEWTKGPLSVHSWGEKLELARISQLNLLKFSKSPVVQQVLDIAAGVPQDVTKAAYSVSHHFGASVMWVDVGTLACGARWNVGLNICAKPNCGP